MADSTISKLQDIAHYYPRLYTDAQKEIQATVDDLYKNMMLFVDIIQSSEACDEIGERLTRYKRRKSAISFIYRQIEWAMSLGENGNAPEEDTFAFYILEYLADKLTEYSLSDDDKVA